jgi:hypothetical protein
MPAGRVCETKQSPKLSEAGGVNVADIWSESKSYYPGEG